MRNAQALRLSGMKVEFQTYFFPCAFCRGGVLKDANELLDNGLVGVQDLAPKEPVVYSLPSSPRSVRDAQHRKVNVDRESSKPVA